jgi:hypothetical protein
MDWGGALVCDGCRHEFLLQSGGPRDVISARDDRSSLSLGLLDAC